MNTEERGSKANERVLTLRQASTEIGVDPGAGYLRQLARAGTIPAFRLPNSRDLMIWRPDFVKWADKRGYTITVFTYDANGKITDLPDSAQSVVDAHSPEAVVDPRVAVIENMDSLSDGDKAALIGLIVG